MRAEPGQGSPDQEDVRFAKRQILQALHGGPIETGDLVFADRHSTDTPGRGLENERSPHVNRAAIQDLIIEGKVTAVGDTGADVIALSDDTGAREVGRR